MHFYFKLGCVGSWLRYSRLDWKSLSNQLKFESSNRIMTWIITSPTFLSSYFIFIIIFQEFGLFKRLATYLPFCNSIHKFLIWFVCLIHLNRIIIISIDLNNKSNDDKVDEIKRRNLFFLLFWFALCYFVHHMMWIF